MKQEFVGVQVVVVQVVVVQVVGDSSEKDKYTGLWSPMQIVLPIEL